MSIVITAWNVEDIVLAGNRRTLIRHRSMGRWERIGWTEGESKVLLCEYLSMGIGHAGTALVADYFLSYLLNEFICTVGRGLPQPLLLKFIDEFVPKYIGMRWIPPPGTFIVFAAFATGRPQIAVLENQRVFTLQEENGVLANDAGFQRIKKGQQVEFAELLACADENVSRAQQRVGAMAGGPMNLLHLSRDDAPRWIGEPPTSPYAKLSDWKRAVACGTLAISKNFR